jgi:membrane-bound lytic murein transglycosylase MltF
MQAGLLAGLLLAFAPLPRAATPPPATPARDEQRTLSVTVSTWTGDFDTMLQRRAIRVLVPYSRTFYFNDRGHERGITSDLMRDFERFLNRKYRKTLDGRPITLVLIPTTRDRLISGIAEGRGDIAAGALTVTPERQQSVDFYMPADLRAFSEVVLNRADLPAVQRVEDLAGQTVHVRRSSSYFDSLTALNGKLRAARKPQVRIELVPDALEDEELMDMLNAGLLRNIVVDDYLARMWSPLLPQVRINGDAALRSGGQAGWAVRKGSAKLVAEINDFYETDVRGAHPVAARLAMSSQRVRALENTATTTAQKRFTQTIELFRKYGTQYGFDPLLLAAQGFQESRLDQQARSAVGAIGIMQIMPATGREMRVGDIRIVENNVHAGARYMDKLMETYFQDAKFDQANRSLFAFAAYNAGPGNMARMRKEASLRGLDPNRWFNHVEVVTADLIGIETTTYVRNIYKYYVSYRLMADAAQARAQARARIEQSARGAP